MADARAYCWTGVFYEDSAPKDWAKRISELRVPCVVSPLHDSDVNDDPDRTPKKPHRHFLAIYPSKKSIDQFMDDFGFLKGPRGQRVASKKGAARYLCHLDNPEKAQYDPKDVQCFSGADYLVLIESASDRYVVVAEMLDFCRVNRLVSYRDLMDYAREHNDRWFRCLCDNGTYVMKEYLRSMAWEEKSDLKYLVYENVQLRKALDALKSERRDSVVEFEELEDSSEDLGLDS